MSEFNWQGNTRRVRHIGNIGNLPQPSADEDSLKTTSRSLCLPTLPTDPERVRLTEALVIAAEENETLRERVIELEALLAEAHTLITDKELQLMRSRG